MTVEMQLTHAAAEARRTVTTVVAPPIQVAARRVRLHRALAAAALVVVAGLLIGIAALLGVRSNEEPTFVDDPPVEVPRNGGPAENAGWSTVPGPDYLTESPNAYIERLANGTWVGLDRGWAPGGGIPSGDPVEVLWTSTDGATWQHRELTVFDGLAVHFSPFEYFRHVFAGLLWAWTGPPDASEPTEVWISEDAETWHRVEWVDEAGKDLSQRLVPALYHQSWRWTFARTEDVVFFTEISGLSSDPAVGSFVSTDTGRTFHRLSVFPPLTRQVLPWSAADGLRAVVSGIDLPPELWRSSDGMTWERIGRTQGLDLTWDSFRTTVSASSDAVLIGGHSSDGSVLRSIDQGRTWERLDVAATVPLYEDRGFDFRKDRGHAVGSTGEWLLVQGNYRAWASRDGIGWVYFGDSSGFGSWLGGGSVDYVGSGGGYVIPPEG